MSSDRPAARHRGCERARRGASVPAGAEQHAHPVRSGRTPRANLNEPMIFGHAGNAGLPHAFRPSAIGSGQGPPHRPRDDLLSCVVAGYWDQIQLYRRHSWEFDARSGCGINPSDCELTRYPCIVNDDGMICVDVGG